MIADGQDQGSERAVYPISRCCWSGQQGLLRPFHDGTSLLRELRESVRSILRADPRQPDEHKFAVYTPLFAPVAVPIVLGLLKELIAWRRRRKARRAQEAATVPPVEAIETNGAEQPDVTPAASTVESKPVAPVDITPVLVEDAGPAPTRNLRSRRKSEKPGP